MFDDNTFDPSDIMPNEGRDFDYDLYDFLCENSSVRTSFCVEEGNHDLNYDEFVIFLDAPTHDNCYFLALNIGDGYFFWAHIIGSIDSLQSFLPYVFFMGRGLINEATLINPKKTKPIMTAHSKYASQSGHYDC